MPNKNIDAYIRQMHVSTEIIENVDVIHKNIDPLSNKNINSYENWILAGANRGRHVCISLFRIDLKT